MSTTVLANAATAATYNMTLQLLFRVLTFLLNAFILRFISRDLLGVVNVRLTLLYSTILFLSREAFRRACMNKATAEKQWKQVINLLWCILPISIVCSSFFGYIWTYILEQPDPKKVEGYKTAVVCFSVSAILEILSEPLFITAQILMYVRLKVVIEGFAIALRCVVTVTLVVLFPGLGVINFCIAQICFTVTISVGYYIYFIYKVYQKERDPELPFQKVRDFFPTIGQSMFSHGLASLTWSFVKQSCLKQILNEGERYVMTVFDVIKLADQGILVANLAVVRVTIVYSHQIAGVFDVVSNLGSLAARFIFLPLEDSGYLFFSQTLTRGKRATDQEKESLALATNVLESLLKVVTWMGLTILCFGYSYSYLLLDLYGGTILSLGAGPPLLKCFCMYVVLMAVNGITECFAAATMSQDELDRFNRGVLVSSVCYLLSLKFLCQMFGSVGLILGNCLNYIARISFSMYHNNNFFHGTDLKPMRSIVPSLPVVVVLLSSFFITAGSEMTFCCDKGVYYRLLHIIIGGICLLFLLVTTYMSERKLVAFVKKQYIDSRFGKNKQS